MPVKSEIVWSDGWAVVETGTLLKKVAVKAVSESDEVAIFDFLLLVSFKGVTAGR